MTPITLHCIVKDQKDQVERLIRDYSEYFAFLDFAIDDEGAYSELKKKYSENKKVRLFHYTHRMPSGRIDFSHKRNFLHKKCQTDYYFRVDTDDEIISPEKIQEVVQRAKDMDVTVICTYYDYSKDEWGNTNAAHYRETIIESTDNAFWNKPIHENIIPVDPDTFVLIHDDSIKINHLIDKSHSEKSVRRNFEYLLEEYQRDKDKTDPRTIAYLGRSLMSFGDFDKAIYFLEQHIKRSGWDGDRYLSWCQLAHIYRIKEDYKQSIACAFEAIQELPNYPDAYFELHDTYFQKEDWQKAVDWALTGFAKPIPKTNMFIDPASYTWRPMLSLAACYFQLSQYEKAYECLLRAKKYVPTLKYITENEGIYEKAVYHRRFVEKFTWIMKYVQDKDPDKLIDLIKSIPSELHENTIISRIMHRYLPPKEWGEKDVVIFCGHTWEQWSPKSVESGIGGSEEAAIHMAKSLKKLGYNVTVYNDCGENEGEYEGVKYLNAVRFNPKDAFNILISWRSNVFSYGVEAKQKIIWVHDLPINLALTEKSVDFFDKIVVLSRYHATLLPDCVPKEKIYISTNGLNPLDFVGLDTIDRNPNRIIYASSYNRGLELLLDRWEEIKKAVPAAELHIFYGWNSYDRAVARGDVKDDGWKQALIKKMQQDGVFEHGRIGHKELLAEYKKSGVFAYYCTYSGEINCIALSKAIACGCLCVTNEKYAVGERNPHKIVSDKDSFIKEVISQLGRNKSNSCDDDFIRDISWESVASDWSENLFKVPDGTLIINRVDWMISQVPRNSRLIEIGCANGVLFKNRKNTTRVDIDNYPKLENFVQANAENLPFKDNEFDVAVLGEILEHVENPQKALKEAARVAKKVIITVPNEYEWANPYTVPFDTMEREEKELDRPREEIYKDSDTVVYFKDDGYQHLRHRRWYREDTFKKELDDAGYRNYKFFNLRHIGIAHFGAIYERQ